MLSSVAIAAILGLAAAQTVDTTQPCSQQPVGYGPIPSPDTDIAFSAFTTFASMANAAVAPSGWQRTFTNLNASEQYDPATMVYLGYQTMTTYDAGQCLSLCDNTTGCVGANLYYERNPTLNPADACPDPPAQTLIKCELWGSPITLAAATNYGQYREQFHVVIAGSNAYMKLPPPTTITLPSTLPIVSTPPPTPSTSSTTPPSTSRTTTTLSTCSPPINSSSTTPHPPIIISPTTSSPPVVTKTSILCPVSEYFDGQLQATICVTAPASSTSAENSFAPYTPGPNGAQAIQQPAAAMMLGWVVAVALV